MGIQKFFRFYIGFPRFTFLKDSISVLTIFYKILLKTVELQIKYSVTFS
jgi:hypothetical protein